MTLLNNNQLILITLLLMSSFNSIAQTQQWYIPTDTSPVNSPAIFVPEGQEWPGYVILPDQVCAQVTVDYDVFCSTTNWDSTCQERYNECAYEINCQPVDGEWGDWYIPNVVESGPIIYTCEAPENYFLADQTCAQFVVSLDSYCVNFNWDTQCQERYNECVYEVDCPDFTGDWYIPFELDTSPIVYACEPPVGFFLADQICAQNLVSNDPYCVNSNWDLVCQDQYNECIYDIDCSDLTGQWYIPSILNSGPIVYSCYSPTGYFLANQTCAQNLVSEDSFCLDSNWDAICSSTYNCCIATEGCGDSEACNYDSSACTSAVAFCVYGGCTYPDADNYNSSAACDDGSCIYSITGNDCPGDFTGDGFVNVNDLGGFLAAFGSSCNLP